MCGRYRQGTGLDALLARFRVGKPPFRIEPRLDIRPSEKAPVLVSDGGRRLELLGWGLVPSWARDLSGPRPINARAETLGEKPSFRRLIGSRRCLVPADGFYEWAPRPGQKRKLRHLVSRREGLFAMAGLWDRWKAPDGPELATFTIVTVGASDALRPLHPRMPAVLARDAEELWLDPAAPWEEVRGLLRPDEGLAAEPFPEPPRAGGGPPSLPGLG